MSSITKKLLTACQELVALFDMNAEAWRIRKDGPALMRARAAIEEAAVCRKGIKNRVTINSVNDATQHVVIAVVPSLTESHLSAVLARRAGDNSIVTWWYNSDSDGYSDGVYGKYPNDAIAVFNAFRDRTERCLMVPVSPSQT